jgi:hypothetical protein
VARSRAGDWIESKSRLSRRLRKLARYTLNPTPMRSRSLYSTGMMVSTTFGIFFLISWLGSFTYFVEFPFIEQAALVGIPFFVTALFSYFLTISLWLYRNAENIFVGELDAFPYWPSDSTRSIRTYMFHDKHGNVKFQTMIAIRAGQLLGKHIRGNGPVFVFAAKENDFDAGLTQRYAIDRKSVKMVRNSPEVLELPSPELVKSLESGYHIGRRYEIPASVKIRLMGKAGSGEDLRDFRFSDGVGWLRPWIRRTWTDLTPLAFLVVALDPHPAAAAMATVRQAAHATNEEWALADMEREKDYWKNKHEDLMRQTSRGKRILREPDELIQEE